jgi:hypothetical protein
MVSLGLTIEGIPSVVLDNAQGMYTVVTHLIETHGCTKIAFVSGQAGHPDAQERYQTYVKALTDPVKFVNTLNRLIYKNVERMRAGKNFIFALRCSVSIGTNPLKPLNRRLSPM